MISEGRFPLALPFAISYIFCTIIGRKVNHADISHDS